MILAVFLLAVSVLWQRCWRQHEEQRKRGVLHAQFAAMLPGALSFEKMAPAGDDQTVRRSGPYLMREVHRGLDPQGKTVGYIVRFRGRGYQNDIEGMLALNASAQQILRLAITESAESPHENLFEDSPEFVRQFQGFDCRSPLTLMRPGDDGIHAITGASISSQIVVRFMNECIQSLKTRVQLDGTSAGSAG